MVYFNSFDTGDLLDRQLAFKIGVFLTERVKSSGKATLVVSGGKTPVGLFNQLSQQLIPWDKIWITLADERWIHTSNEESNENLVKKYLLVNQAKSAQFLGLKNIQPTPYSGMEICESILKTLPSPFDVVVLGMGDDGHTASLFPGTKNLIEAMDLHTVRLCMGITPLHADYQRMTLTCYALLNSRKIYLHIVGNQKKSVYERALNGVDINEMPIRAILHQEKVPVYVYWSSL